MDPQTFEQMLVGCATFQRTHNATTLSDTRTAGIQSAASETTEKLKVFEQGTGSNFAEIGQSIKGLEERLSQYDQSLTQKISAVEQDMQNASGKLLEVWAPQ